MYNKLPLAVRHLDGQRRIYIYTDRESDQSSLCAHMVRSGGGLKLSSCDSEDSDQTGQMPRLILVFAGHTSFRWFCHALAHMYVINCLWQ